MNANSGVDVALGKMALGMTLPRLGFVGVGWIGRHRLGSVVDSGAAEVTAVFDLAKSQAEGICALAPDAECMESMEQLLSKDLDGIVIATPNSFHAEQAVAALDRGISVFCQKPVGRNYQETMQVVEAARRANRLLGIDLSYRHTEGMVKLRRLIQSGELGQIFSIDLTFHNAYGPDKPWFYDRRLSGGGCVLDLGIHLIDLALWVLDYPEVKQVTSRLYAGGKKIKGDEEVEDFACARLDLATGTTVTIACSWNLPAGQDAVISASFYGTRGGGHFHNINGSFYDFTTDLLQGTTRKPLAVPPDDWGGRAIVAWVHRLAVNSRFEPGTNDILHVAEVVDRVYQSAS